MAALPLSEPAVSALKKELRDQFPDVRSSHLTEAIAAALGFSSNAALRAQIRSIASDHPYECLDDQRFDARLQEFGYPPDPEFSFEWIEKPFVVSTIPLSAYDIEYRTTRERAWRNLMICAINEGVRQKLFSVRPGDNRWPSERDSDGSSREGHLFDFRLPIGLSARAYVYDIGFDEIAINAAVNPKGILCRASNAGFDAGDAFATGWLERQRGAWLQSSRNLFHCRRILLNQLADIEVQPAGFGDRGNVIM